MMQALVPLSSSSSTASKWCVRARLLSCPCSPVFASLVGRLRGQVSDVPVGHNLQDHMFVPLTWESKIPTLTVDVSIVISGPISLRSVV
jgi:hypothetical protein